MGTFTWAGCSARATWLLLPDLSPVLSSCRWVLLLGVFCPLPLPGRFWLLPVWLEGWLPRGSSSPLLTW